MMATRVMRTPTMMMRMLAITTMGDDDANVGIGVGARMLMASVGPRYMGVGLVQTLDFVDLGEPRT